MAYFLPDNDETTDFTKPQEYRLYVADIPEELNEDGVRSVFNHYGKIIGLFYRPRATWAFVTYGTYREAELALRDLHDQKPLYLKISFGKEKTSSEIRQKKSNNEITTESQEQLTYDSTTQLIQDTTIPQCNDKARMKTIGKGNPINTISKQKLGSQLPTHRYNATDDLLYPVPTDPYTYDPYESVEPSNHTNALWTRGTVTVTSDGKRHVSHGRGYTAYEIPDPHPEIETLISKVHEKRINGLYEHGQDSLKHMVGKCVCCNKVTKTKCEICYSFYCSKKCQIMDWPRHKTDCHRIPALIKDTRSLSSSSNDENVATIKPPRTQRPLRRPNKPAEALLNKSVEVPNKKLTSVRNTESSNKEKYRNYNETNNIIKTDNAASKLMTIGKDGTEKKELINSLHALKVEDDLVFQKDTFLSTRYFTQVEIVELSKDGQYWVQKVDQKKAFEAMMLSLDNTSENMPKKKPIVGNMYAHKFEGIWHRVHVISINPTKIFFIDYGTIGFSEDDDFRDVNMKNIPPFAKKIRLSENAKKIYVNLKLQDIINVKAINFDRNVIIVDVKHKEKSHNSSVKSVTESQLDDTSAAPKLLQNIKENKSKNVKNTKKIFFSLPCVIDLLSENVCGLLEVHAVLSNNTYGVTLLPDNLLTEFEQILYELPEQCSCAELDNEFKVNIGELVCGQRTDGDWLRGCVVALEPIQLAIIDEARVIPVTKVIPYPEKFKNICKFGVICEVTTNYKLQPSGHYDFKVISCTNEVEIQITMSENNKVTAIIKLWEPKPEQSGIKYSQIKSGYEVCITAYHSPTKLYVRSLQTEDLEKFHKIMQDVAKSAQSAPHLKEPPVVGEMVMAQYVDNNFYRAIVTQIQEEEVVISYVDFGNGESTSWKKLKVLSPDLKMHPSCTANVTLKDVPSDVAMTEDVSDYLLDLTGREVPLICNFTGIPSKDGVSLISANGGSINDKINQLLIPSWKKDNEEDKIVYVEQDMNIAELGGEDETSVMVLSTLVEGAKYVMCPLDIDLITNVYDVLPGLMNEYCAKSKYYIPRKNELCIGLYEDAWYRAVCVNPSVSAEKCQLFFLDYGNMEYVLHKNIRAMSKDFLTPAGLGSICTVVNLVPEDDVENVSPMVLKRISELVIPGDSVVVKIVKTVENGHYTIELPKVHDTLIQEKLIFSS